MAKDNAAYVLLFIVAFALVGSLFFLELGSISDVQCSETDNSLKCSFNVNGDGDSFQDFTYCSKLPFNEAESVDLTINEQKSALQCSVSSFSLVECGASKAGVKFSERAGCALTAEFFKDLSVDDTVNQDEELSFWQKIITWIKSLLGKFGL